MDEYLDGEQAAAYIPGMTKALLAQLRFKGTGPVFLKPTPRKVIYRRSDLDKWLADSVQTSTRASA
ncbi:hypothetical protein EDF38_0141 [Frigoribacterium sp. PhB160]|uniref:helix-turn-helix transcriptional regulator n=1 Tax=Frigoribacterium sp. PhB160 TaxID=2485192 RepID=UPI000F4AEC36|nr:hypothetical protein [Frigoribacterium sp. PhB160]ROS61062.1 hypothetical protein EDF38_0141 [Frigoribacterium sp. PhB160]